MSETIERTGTVWGVFAHRVALETSEGKVLVDLGPKGGKALRIAEGDRITVRGDRKPSEIKVASLVTTDGVDHAIAWPDKDESKDGPADPAIATAAAEREGYAVTGQPKRKPKHWEVPAARDGSSAVLHVELDGTIRKVKSDAIAA